MRTIIFLTALAVPVRGFLVPCPTRAPSVTNCEVILRHVSRLQQQYPNVIYSTSMNERIMSVHKIVQQDETALPSPGREEKPTALLCFMKPTQTLDQA